MKNRSEQQNPNWSTDESNRKRQQEKWWIYLLNPNLEKGKGVESNEFLNLWRFFRHPVTLQAKMVLQWYFTEISHCEHQNFLSHSCGRIYQLSPLLRRCSTWHLIIYLHYLTHGARICSISALKLGSSAHFWDSKATYGIDLRLRVKNVGRLTAKTQKWYLNLIKGIKFSRPTPLQV